MASKSKRNRQRRKRKEALLAAPDVAVTVAVASPDKEKKMGGGIMTPPEREKYQLGSLARLAAKGASSLLKGAKKDSSQSLKSLEKKLTAETSDPNITSFTTKELSEKRKEIGDDSAFEDYLSEFAIIRDQDEAIAKIAQDRKIPFSDAEDIYQKKIYLDDDPYEGGYIKENRLTARDLKRRERNVEKYEKALKEDYGYTDEKLLEIKKRNDNFVDYEIDLAFTLEEEGVSAAEIRAFNEIDEPSEFIEGFEDTPTGQWEGQTINDPPRFLKKAEGGEVPVDTYPNIPPEQMAAVEASQLPDDQMEDKYIDYVLNEALQPEEQTYLMNALENDPQLSMIFDKVVGTASEFTGSGEVAGPGTGVSDSIPARLSDGEFVMTKKATDQIGADRLQRMMDEAERAYDGGLMRKDEDTDLEDDMNKVMLSANQMPSLNVRQR